MIIPVLAFLLLLAVVVLAFAPHPPKVPSRVDNKAELEAHLNRLVASGNPPGLSVTVVKDGKIVYNRAFGYADGPKGTLATPETVYHWWSMTKIPTAIAIMQLQERGKLHLDDSVTQHLSWFKAVYPSFRGRYFKKAKVQG